MIKLATFLMFMGYFFVKAQSIEDSRNDIMCEIEKGKSISEIYFLADSLDSKLVHYQDLFLKIPCINPLNPDNIKRISSGFGKRFHPIDRKYKVHNGIDISTNIGKAVYAAADGIIIDIEYSNKGYGKNVTIQHAYGYTTRYAHMSLILVLKKGQVIRLGEAIGMVGSTGKSTGNHLHFEIQKNQVYLNPTVFMKLRNTLISSSL